MPTSFFTRSAPSLIVIIAIAGVAPPVVGQETAPVAVPGQVAPALATAPTGDEAMDLGLWQAFRRRNIQENPDTQTAVARALEFLRAGVAATPALHPTVAIDGWSAMGYITHRKLRDTGSALKIYDEALNLYKADSHGLGLVLEKARLYLYSGKPVQVEQLIVDQRKSIIQSDAVYARPLLWQYGLALKAQGKTAELLPFLQNVLLETPSLLEQTGQRSEGWIYRFIVEALLKKGRADQALSWAKLAWMECAFDETQIYNSTTLLSKVWRKQQETTQPPSSLQAFLAVQEVSGASYPDKSPDGNPLIPVAMPAIDYDAVEEKLVALSSKNGDASHERNTHQRISLLILSQGWKRAMTEARQLWLDRPQSILGLQEITRVFKAHDLGVMRANTFLSWNQDRQGPSPVDSFLTELGK